MRRGGAKKRRDATEPAIIAALRACGCGVWQLSGAGLPDLLVRAGGRWLPLEVKSATGVKTKAQQAIPWLIVRTVADALSAVGVTK